MNNQSQQAPQKISRVIAQSAEGYPLLGNCIYWSFSDMQMPHSDFKAMLNDLGINPDLAPETRPKSALTKALKASTKDNRRTQFHRKVVDDRDIASFAIVNTAIDAANDDVNFQTETKVRFDKKHQFAVVDGTQEAKDMILGKMREFQTSYTTDQIRSSILRFIYQVCQGVMVRENGGIYFIPAQHMDEFNKLKDLFAKLAKVGNCSIETIPVIDTADSAKAMWKALISEAKGAMSDMKKDIEKMDDEMNQRAQDRRIEKFQELRTKIEMYEVLLNGTANDLKAELTDVEKSFRTKLGI